MKLIALAALSGMFVAGPAAAQDAAPPFKPSQNPVTDSVVQRLARDGKFLAASADLMPADKYGFKPTPAQMSFGQLVVHVVQTNVYLCSAIGGLQPDVAVFKLSDAAPKATLVADIRKSIEVCAQALAKTTDASLGEEVALMGRGTGQSRASAMVTIAADWADHYSTAAAYLRLNGILPPSAPPAK